MLKTRVLTAVVLFVLFFAAIFLLPAAGWVAFVTLTAAIAAWEWGGFLCLSQAGRLALGGALGVLCCLLAWSFPGALGIGGGSLADAWALGRWFYGVAALFWVIVVPLWMLRRWRLGQLAAGVLVGVVVLLPTWLALIQLRALGAVALLALMAVVWIADIAAYFFGRRFGRHKLAPAISPGKTWEGAAGALLAVLLYGFVLSGGMPPLLAGNAGLLALTLIAVTAVSILGDLFESLLKRQAGLKDSSNILPGHGGVMDRIDSLTSTLPIAALVWLAGTLEGAV